MEEVYNQIIVKWIKNGRSLHVRNLYLIIVKWIIPFIDKHIFILYILNHLKFYFCMGRLAWKNDSFPAM